MIQRPKCYQCGVIDGHKSPCPKLGAEGRDREARERRWKRGFLAALSGGELVETASAYRMGWARGRIEWSLSRDDRTSALGVQDGKRAFSAWAQGFGRCVCANVVMQEGTGHWPRCKGCGLGF